MLFQSVNMLESEANGSAATEAVVDTSLAVVTPEVEVVVTKVAEVDTVEVCFYHSPCHGTMYTDLQNKKAATVVAINNRAAVAGSRWLVLT